MSKISSQQAFDRLATLAAKINKFKITLTTDDQGTTKELTLQEWLQTLEAHQLDGVKQELADLTKLVGSYATDDVDGNLDTNASVIANLSIAVSNITAILNREKDYATKQEVTDGDTKLQKQVDVINSAGVHIPHFTSEANRDRAIPNPNEGQTCYVGANTAWTLNTYENGAWVNGLLSQHSTSALPADFEEKEITITPAIYGWKTIDQATYAFSANDIGKKVKIYSNIGTGNDRVYSALINHFKPNYIMTSSKIIVGNFTFEYEFNTSDNTNIKQIRTDLNTGAINVITLSGISNLEIWDIITPAVKATVLVKK